MPSLHLLTKWIREYGHDPRQRPRLIGNRYLWHQIWAAVDIAMDTERALINYIFGSFPTNEGERYLRMFGVMQALFLQQEALVDLINAVYLSGTIEVNDVLKDIRAFREAGAGHPTRLNRRAGLASHSIVAGSVTKNGFDLHSFPREGGGDFEHIPVLQLAVEQRQEAFRVMSEVVNELRWLDFEDRKRFRDIKLAKVFDRVAYGFVKLLEGLRGEFVLGSWGVENFRESLNDFERLMKERGMSLGACDSTKYLYEQIEQPLEELTKFLKGETSQILSNQGAVVFARALEGSFEQLRRIAGEIDDEYASLPPDIDSGGPTARIVIEAPKRSDVET
jgi:hypothetical protein